MRSHDYGLNLGYAFQIADDVLDYASDAETLGKNLGDDLAEGKATLPLIHAMLHSDAGTRERLRHRSNTAIPTRCRTSCSDSCHRRPRLQPPARLRIRGGRRAFARGLDDNDYTAALHGLAHYAVNRDH